jgi:RimJ/RimL family protein N-acetyltransferase
MSSSLHHLKTCFLKGLAEMNTPVFYIDQIDTPDKAIGYAMGLKNLLHSYRHVLLDDSPNTFTGLNNKANSSVAGQTLTERLFQNTCSLSPWLWVVACHLNPQQGNTQQAKNHPAVLAACGLSDVISPCHATLHGVYSPRLRRHPVLSELRATVFEAAFVTLQLNKLKAVFESDNWGAKGFCWQNKFVKEGCLKQEVLINGQYKDVDQYALFASGFL